MNCYYGSESQGACSFTWFKTSTPECTVSARIALQGREKQYSQHARHRRIESIQNLYDRKLKALAHHNAHLLLVHQYTAALHPKMRRFAPMAAAQARYLNQGVTRQKQDQQHNVHWRSKLLLGCFLSSPILTVCSSRLIACDSLMASVNRVP